MRGWLRWWCDACEAVWLGCMRVCISFYLSARPCGVDFKTVCCGVCQDCLYIICGDSSEPGRFNRVRFRCVTSVTAKRDSSPNGMIIPV
ncbi:uncharacterized protein K452DRAFT_107243 [Aplosporella prunicola CBS 121167]|uniref:Secreted protein n=1 Tax=Aplosporella prunicola CBS 121167 TaxID=1176127 RepID=A0A6A6BU76_9PEZI|nr:uncharacterized protein K452DRAFT_107243 [Aplosporella prunicola CBS 121167]KAF2146191.1 hypothetical protein K452DRAFT_107243 [Aplosporella prunicola CBS 121167]